MEFVCFILFSRGEGIVVFSFWILFIFFGFVWFFWSRREYGVCVFYLRLFFEVVYGDVYLMFSRRGRRGL